SDDPLIGIEASKDRDFAPFRQTGFELKLVRISDSFVLNLQTERNIAFVLQIRGHDLAETFGRRARDWRFRRQKRDCYDKGNTAFHLQQSAAKNKQRDVEINNQSGDIDERVDERRGGGPGAESQPTQ